MKNRFVRVFLGTLAFLAVVAAGSAVVMLLWNWLVPAVIGWGPVTFWQALGLILLCRLLFGGLGRRHFGHGRHGGHWHYTWKERAEMCDRMKRMNRDERRDYIRRHMFGGEPGQPEKTDDDAR